MPGIPDLNQIVVTGRYTMLSGVDARGTVTFAPVLSGPLIDHTNRQIVIPTKFVATLDVNGSFTISLPATNDPDLDPSSGFVYTVTESITDGVGRTYSIQVPYDSDPIDLSNYAPTPDAIAVVINYATVSYVVSQVNQLTSAVASKVPLSEVGQPSGVAQLDSSGKVPLGQLPSDISSGGAETYVGWNGTGSAPSRPSGTEVVTWGFPRTLDPHAQGGVTVNEGDIWEYTSEATATIEDALVMGLRCVGAKNFTGNNLTITLSDMSGGTVVAGDVLFAVVATQSNDLTSGKTTCPAPDLDWHLIGTTASATGATKGGVTTFWRKFDPNTDFSFTFFISGGSAQRSVVQLYAMSNAKSTAPVDGAGTVTSGGLLVANTTRAQPAIVTNTKRKVWAMYSVAGFAEDNSAAGVMDAGGGLGVIGHANYGSVDTYFPSAVTFYQLVDAIGGTAPGLAFSERDVSYWGAVAWVAAPAVIDTVSTPVVRKVRRGGVWRAMEPFSHNLLENLNNDDHPQYHTDARGDARYLQHDIPAGAPMLAQISGGNVIQVPNDQPTAYIVLGTATGTTATLWLRLDEPTDTNSILDKEVIIVQDSTGRDFDFDQSIAFPGSVWPPQISKQPNSLTYARFKYLTAAGGWVCVEFLTGIDRLINPLPATAPAGGNLYIGGFAVRQPNRDLDMPGDVNGVVHFIPTAVLQFLASRNVSLHLLGHYGSDPTDSRQIGAWGGLFQTDTNVAMVATQTIAKQFTTAHTPTHELSHGADFNWAYSFDAVRGLLFSGIYYTQLSTHPTFVSIYNAAVNDNTINHTQYAFTNSREFWAETLSWRWQNKKSDPGADTLLLSILGNITRVNSMDAFYTSLGL